MENSAFFILLGLNYELIYCILYVGNVINYQWRQKRFEY